jgi:hypothetical protein
MKTKFLSICLGVSAVVFSIAFLIRSVAPAQAAPAPQEFLDAGTNKIGKYMMILSPETEKFYENVTIWDTETGASVRYSKKPSGFEKSALQLPEKPL